MRYAESRPRKGRFYECRCDCGTIKLVKASTLRNGTSRSCGCLQRETISRLAAERHAAKLIPSGTRFGRLTVECVTDRRDRWQSRYYTCRCDCGNVTDVIAAHLAKGNTKSCGCLVAEVSRATAHRIGLGKTGRITHNLCQHPAYKAWYRVRDRCTNPNAPSYRYYGARGIKLARAWQTVEPFVEWSLSHGWAPGYHIHRIDSDGPYSPSNCEWLSPAEHHRRHSKHSPTRG